MNKSHTKFDLLAFLSYVARKQFQIEINNLLPARIIDRLTMSKTLKINLQEEMKRQSMEIAEKKAVNNRLRLHAEDHSYEKKSSLKPKQKAIRKESVKVSQNQTANIIYNRSINSRLQHNVIVQERAKQTWDVGSQNYRAIRTGTNAAPSINIPFLKEVRHEANDLPFDAILKSRNSYNDDSEDFIMMDEPAEMGLEASNHLCSTFLERKQSTMQCTFKPSALKEQLSDALRSTEANNSSYVNTRTRKHSCLQSVKTPLSKSRRTNSNSICDAENSIKRMPDQQKRKMYNLRRNVHADRKSKTLLEGARPSSQNRKTPSPNSSIRKGGLKVSPSTQQNKLQVPKGQGEMQKKHFVLESSKTKVRKTSAKPTPKYNDYSHEYQYERALHELHKKIQRLRI